MDSERMDELKQLAKRIMEIADKCGGSEESEESESMSDEGSEDYSSKGSSKVGAAMKLFGKKV